MSLINCKINLFLTWSANCFIIHNPVVNQVPTFALTDTKLYVLIVTLSTQDNVKLLQQWKLDFIRTTNWNKYQLKATIQRRNQYLDYLIDTSFQGVNRIFVLSFEDGTRTSYQRYFLPNAKIKDCNVIIDEQIFFDQLVKKYLATYNNIHKFATGQGDDYTAGCLLGLPYFRKIIRWQQYSWSESNTKN